MKYFTLLIIMAFSVSLQSQIQIDYMLNQGKIDGFSLENMIRLFHVNRQGKIDFIELDYTENNKKSQLVAEVNNTKIFVERLYEIQYPDTYPISNLEESLPIIINGHIIKYYTDFYDDDCLKGKIKSIDHLHFTYYTDYYLPKEIKGNLKSIGNLSVLYFNDYPLNEKVKGEIKYNYLDTM